MEDTKSVISQLSKDSRKLTYGRRIGQRGSIFNKDDAKSPNGETTSQQGAQRTLKLSGVTNYYFPKRQRFNENIDREIESQRGEKPQ